MLQAHCCSNRKASNNLRHAEVGFSLMDVSNNSASIPRRNYSLQSEYTVHILKSYFYTSVDIIAIDIFGTQYRNFKIKFTDTILCNKRNKGFGMYISHVASMVLERMNVTNVTAPIVVLDS